MIIINDTFELKGGSQTLMIRICKWLVNHNEEIIYLCNRDDNKNAIEQIETIGGRVYNVGGDRINNLIIFFKNNTINTNKLLVINYSINYYIEIEIVKKELSLEFDNIVYCIIPDTFEKGRGISNSFLRNILRKPYKSILEKMNRNNAVVMMDEVCEERTEKWNNTKLNPDTPLIRLPITFEPNESFETDIAKGYNSRNILTASRADFPFKGYLLGLVKDFEEIKKSHSDVKLTIIASGKDEDQLKFQINQLPEEIKADVNLISWIAYEDLLTMIRSCYVFVGMSSTLLDAAKLYKICVPSKGYTEKNFANSFFDEDPRYLYASDDCTKPAIRLIIECLDWDFEYYRERSLSHYRAVKSEYDEDQNIGKLISVKTRSKNCILSGVDMFLYQFYSKSQGKKKRLTCKVIQSNAKAR